VDTFTILSHYCTTVAAGDAMPQDEHTLKRFDNELEAICTQMMKMGGLVEMQFTDAMDALCNSNSNLARRIIDQDQQVNQFEVEIDALCCNAIACYKPTASDLRWIVTSTKIIVHLERIGDEIKKIAHMTERRIQQYHLAMPRFSEIKLVAERTQAMLKDVLDSYARLDPQFARNVIERNDLVKAEFDNILRQLIKFMTENPHTISTSLDFFLITKAIERISNHVKFIAELVMEPSNRYCNTQHRQQHMQEV
jgi:phosphate transport system protein